MRRRSATTLLLALLCGGLAAYLALGSLREGTLATAGDGASGAPLQVVVATRALPGGAILGPDDVRAIPWPGETLPAGFIPSPDRVVGHGLLAPVEPNEPLLASKLAGEGAGGGLPILIPPGMRAVSVRVDDVIAVAGFVVPGTRVDILATIAPVGAQEVTSRVVLQNVQVLAAGQSVSTDDGKPQDASVITLLVTPREAEVLTLAAAEGRIQLALRNRRDTEVMMTPGAWIQALTGQRPEAPGRERPSIPLPRRSAVEIYNGSARTVVTFEGA